MKSRVLVLGASGMVGHLVALRLQERDEQFEIITAARDASSMLPHIQLDAADFNALEEVVKHIKPDICVNAIGILNKADPDVESLEKLNADLPQFLSSLGKKTGFSVDSHQYRLRIFRQKGQSP